MFLLGSPEYTEAAGVGIIGAACAASMPITNLFKAQPSDVARFSSLTGMYFEVDLGSAKEVEAVALLYTNATAPATFRLRGATSQAGLTSSPPYDSGTLSPFTGIVTADYPRGLHWLHVLTAAQTLRWWRVDIVDAANPAGFFQAGNFFPFAAISPANGYDYGYKLGYIDDAATRTSEGGQRYKRQRIRRRFVEFSMNLLTEAEAYDDVDRFMRLRGVSSPAIVALDTDARVQNRMVYGTLEENLVLSFPDYDDQEASLRVEEMP